MIFGILMALVSAAIVSNNELTWGSLFGFVTINAFLGFMYYGMMSLVDG